MCIRDRFISALKSQKGFGEVINLGSNFEISIGDTAKLIAEVMSPWQYSKSLTLTVDTGFTVITNVESNPKHPFRDGVTVIVSVCAILLEFKAVKERMSPFCGPLIPIELFVLFQSKEVRD